MPRYAAIDIGSNSIRMEAAEVAPGQAIRVLASDREVTRLGESVFRTGSVSDEALRATCAVLARMAALYRKLEVVGVRAVATSADPRYAQSEGVPGARLGSRGHAGRNHLRPRRSAADPPGRGERLAAEGPAHADDRYRRRQRRDHRRRGRATARGLFEAARRGAPEGDFSQGRSALAAAVARDARIYSGETGERARRRLGNAGWDRAIATSATASAVASAVSRVPRSKRDEIDRLRISGAQVKRLYAQLSQLNLAARRKVTGIGPRRAEIIVPGLAVLLDFLRQFQLPAVYYSRAGRARRHHRRPGRAQRGRRALALEPRPAPRSGGDGTALRRPAGTRAQRSARRESALHRARPIHGLPPAAGKLLEAAAYLCDIGHYVSSASHHKHSYYVVANSDMAGFTDRERVLIASLCRYHRKSLPSPLHSAYRH